LPKVADGLARMLGTPADQTIDSADYTGSFNREFEKGYRCRNSDYAVFKDIISQCHKANTKCSERRA